jgi:hypothetical protein
MRPATAREKDILRHRLASLAAGGRFEGGKQGRGAVALVIVAVPAQRPAVRRLQIALRPFQDLDRRQMTTEFSSSAAGFRGNSLVPAREGG